jgi:hypothetical protein
MELPTETEYTTEILTEIIKNNFGIPIDFIGGIVKEKGKYKNKENNQIWIIDDNNWYMFCQPHVITKLCKISYENIIEFEKKIKKLSWYYYKTGYICTTIHNHNISTIAMHQVIMNYYGNGRGTGGADSDISSIDHMDRNRLNNSYNNLHIATRKEQEDNSKGIMDGTKRERRYDACELPDDITQQMMPKYVTFNKNVWDQLKGKVRYYFRIEHHPLMNGKIWESSKSMKLTNEEKLNKTIEVLNKLNNGILPEPNIRDMPKYTYFTKNEKDKYTLNYDNRDKKFTKKMTIQDELFDFKNIDDIQKQLYIFNKKITYTFGEECSIFDENYEYTGTFIDDNEYIELPKYISSYIDKESAILCYTKRTENKVCINKKITLKCPYNELNEKEKDAELLRLNCELIKKYGKEYDFMGLTDEEHKNIEESLIGRLPTYIRIHRLPIDGSMYMYFEKGKGKERLNKSMKLLKNYNLHKELLRFHTILAQYGTEYTFELPVIVNVPPIELPKNIYINDQCDNPYIFEIKAGKSYYMYLPDKYSISEVLQDFLNGEPIEEIKLATEQQKGKNSLKNISIAKKGKYMTLCYQLRENINKISEYITLPSDVFDYNIELVRLNNKLIEKHGKNASFLLV